MRLQAQAAQAPQLPVRDAACYLRLVSDLLIGALSALLATNPPTALSNLVHARTGIPIPIVDPNDPVEKEYVRLLEMDDEAQAEADRWLQENQTLRAAGAGFDPASMRAKTLARFEPVKKAYDAFLAAHPDHARARLAYGGFLSDIGEEEPAFKQWEKARDLDPKNPVAWNNLANFYGHNGPVTNAFACYARALELQPGEPLYFHNYATTVFLFRKDAMEYFKLTEPQVFDKALGLYRQARALDPDNFLLATDLAQCYYVMKPPKAADPERELDAPLRTIPTPPLNVPRALRSTAKLTSVSNSIGDESRFLISTPVTGRISSSGAFSDKRPKTSGLGSSIVFD